MGTDGEIGKHARDLLTAWTHIAVPTHSFCPLVVKQRRAALLWKWRVRIGIALVRGKIAQYIYGSAQSVDEAKQYSGGFVGCGPSSGRPRAVDIITSCFKARRRRMHGCYKVQASFAPALRLLCVVSSAYARASSFAPSLSRALLSAAAGARNGPLARLCLRSAQTTPSGRGAPRGALRVALCADTPLVLPHSGSCLPCAMAYAAAPIALLRVPRGRVDGRADAVAGHALPASSFQATLSGCSLARRRCGAGVCAVSAVRTHAAPLGAAQRPARPR